MKDDILQLNFHTFIGSWVQFEELHEPFVNLGAYLPPKHNSPKEILKFKIFTNSLFRHFDGEWSGTNALRVRNTHDNLQTE